MTRLPPHHVPRPRLTGRSEGYQVVVIEAAAGYGKTVLAAELVHTWRSVGIEAQLEHGGVSAPLLAARLLHGPGGPVSQRLLQPLRESKTR